MAKLGSEKRPIIVRVHTEETARYVAETCAKHGWHHIIGFELDRPEDLSDLERMLNPPKSATSQPRWAEMIRVRAAVAKSSKSVAVRTVDSWRRLKERL
jgi:hypothetical protein